MRLIKEYILQGKNGEFLSIYDNGALIVRHCAYQSNKMTYYTTLKQARLVAKKIVAVDPHFEIIYIIRVTKTFNLQQSIRTKRKKVTNPPRLEDVKRAKFTARI